MFRYLPLLEMANNEVMEVSGESCDGPWPTRNEKIFIRLMDEEVKSKKSKETGTFTGEAWKRIKRELKMFGRDFSSDSSDPEFKIIDEPEVESAGGSKTKPKAKNKKRDSIAANISSALSIFAENGKRRVDVMEKKLHCSHPNCSGVTGSMSIGEMDIGALAAGMKESQALLNIMEDLDEDSYNKVGGVTGSMSIGEMDIGALAAGMKESQALLNIMEDLDEDSYNKVLEKLHDDILWRQMFLDMPEKKRIAWIKKL
ncbi:hypothetical protein RHSIM_Rhsim01G0206100 [Rhododendron simsii]|uniref:Myb/SANT-like domain-containing protein n=1 Tax=Rhododendron simsii TaxID=118357 RepID=A0A834LYK8_RHOSS|nr:hypothetical protein RHSIM_Rhsim01G0206100 [Rhododendron simsii]